MKNKAFTLIELLVVILIIGILAAIAYPQYQFSIDKSNFAKLRAYEKYLIDAYQRYYFSNNESTSRFDNLDVDFPYKRQVGVSGYRCRINGDMYCCVAGNISNAITCGMVDYSFGIWVHNIPTKPQYWCVAKRGNKRATKLCKSLWNGKPTQTTGHLSPDGILNGISGILIGSVWEQYPINP